MKKICLSAAFVALSFLCAADEKTTAPTPAPAPATASCAAAKKSACADQCGSVDRTCSSCKTTEESGLDFRLSRIARGLTNVVTCPLEMPRCMILGNSAVPFWGFIAGTVDGVGTTAMRAFSGVTDMLFLGFDAGTVYNDDFREFVWESRWQLKSKSQSPAPAAKP